MHVALTCHWASTVLVEDVVPCFFLFSLFGSTWNDWNRGCRWELTEGAENRCANLDGTSKIWSNLTSCLWVIQQLRFNRQIQPWFDDVLKLELNATFLPEKGRNLVDSLARRALNKWDSEPTAWGDISHFGRFTGGCFGLNSWRQSWLKSWQHFEQIHRKWET